jgi:Ca2+-binding RTX toxin-like protein
LSVNQGNDTLLGSEGNDKLLGATGNDILNGGAGRDIILGGAGRDALTGAQGNDILVAGSGSDTLTGGAGADDFAFTRPNEGIDTIRDFVVADRILVSATGFGGGLTAGAAIKPSQFTYGKAAGDASDRFIYDTGTGALYFDVDGTGTAKQVQIAGLTTKPLITNADIFVTPNIVSQSSTVQSTQISTPEIDFF